MTRKLILAAVAAMGLLVSVMGSSKAHAGGWYYNSYYGQWMYYR